MRLGTVLREHRRQRGMKTSDVAQIVGVKQAAISKWENGRSAPGDDKLDAIASFLGVSRSEVVLMRDGGNPEPEGGRTSELEERIERLEGQVEGMIQLLRDLDRRTQDRSRGGDEGG